MGRKANSGGIKDSSGNNIETASNPIAESSGKYILSRGDSKAKALTNFTMRPVNGIKSDSAYLMDIEFTTIDGQTFFNQIDSSIFASTQLFKKAIKKIGGIDMVFDGNESDLANIQLYMNNKYRDYNHCLGLDYVGMYKMDGAWYMLEQMEPLTGRGIRSAVWYQLPKIMRHCGLEF